MLEANIKYILVVDDEENNRDILVRSLSRRGYNMLSASGGREALEMLSQREDIDLVLLDIRMPDMDGNEVLETLRKSYSATQLPVIMVTAEVDSSSVIKSLGLGADDYATKPIDLPVLVARIESKLQLKASVEKQIEESSSHATGFPDAEKILQLIAQGENNQVEFKSTLRWNIHAKNIGKEIEVAWLKTVVAFLNTDGGILLIGVNDDGEILGTQLDKFKSDDRYLLHVNSLIKTSIGMDYINKIAFDLVAVGEHKVLCIQCSPSSEAVFLKNAGEEEFYARFGPGTQKLTAKDMLAFVNNR